MNSFNGLRGMPGPCTEWLCWATEGTAITGNAGRGEVGVVGGERGGGGWVNKLYYLGQNVIHPTLLGARAALGGNTCRQSGVNPSQTEIAVSSAPCLPSSG